MANPKANNPFGKWLAAEKFSHYYLDSRIALCGIPRPIPEVPPVCRLRERSGVSKARTFNPPYCRHCMRLNEKRWASLIPPDVATEPQSV